MTSATASVDHWQPNAAWLLSATMCLTNSEHYQSFPTVSTLPMSQTVSSSVASEIPNTTVVSKHEICSSLERGALSMFLNIWAWPEVRNEKVKEVYDMDIFIEYQNGNFTLSITYVADRSNWCRLGICTIYCIILHIYQQMHLCFHWKYLRYIFAYVSDVW